MNEYLQALSRALSRLDQSEREDILADLREHFEIGLSQGKTEKQIATELGDPNSIARLYTAVSATATAEKTKKPGDAFRMVGATFAYRMGKGMAIGTLYTAFILCVIPLFVLGPALWLSAAGAVFLAAMNFIRGFIVYGMLSVFTAVMLAALGTLCMMGTRYLWSVTIGGLSALARRWLGKEEEKEI